MAGDGDPVMANLGADPEMLARYRVMPAGYQSGEAPSVYAPCCGRRTDCDSVLDVRMIDGIAQDWLCNACRHRLVADRRNGWTKSKLTRAAGLGWPEVRELRAKELLAERMRRDGRLQIEDAIREMERELPERDIPGTEAPPGIARVR